MMYVSKQINLELNLFVQSTRRRCPQTPQQSDKHLPRMLEFYTLPTITTEKDKEIVTTYIITGEEHGKVGQRARPRQIIGGRSLEVQHCHRCAGGGGRSLG